MGHVMCPAHPNNSQETSPSTHAHEAFALGFRAAAGGEISSRCMARGACQCMVARNVYQTPCPALILWHTRQYLTVVWFRRWTSDGPSRY